MPEIAIEVEIQSGDQKFLKELRCITRCPQTDWIITDFGSHFIVVAEFIA